MLNLLFKWLQCTDEEIKQIKKAFYDYISFK